MTKPLTEEELADIARINGRPHQDIVDGLWEIIEHQNAVMSHRYAENKKQGEIYRALGPLEFTSIPARATTFLALATLEAQKLTRSDEIVDMCREIEGYGHLYRDSAIVNRAKDIRAAIEKE